MSRSLAASNRRLSLYSRRNPSPPLLFQNEFERFLLSTKNVLATVNEEHEADLRTSDLSNADEVLKKEVQSPRTVEEIEKWLKNFSEPVSSTKFGKNDSRASMEKYLSEHLPEIFFDKEFMTGESNIAMSYDALFKELQNESLISACEKDNVFILPDLQLDNLDELAYCTDDMILTSEIIPTTYEPPPCTNINVDAKDFFIRLEETINFISDSNNVVDQKLSDNQFDNDSNFKSYVNKEFCNDSLTTNIKELYTDNSLSCNNSETDDSNNCLNLDSNEDTYTIESHSLTLQSSDPLSPTKLHIKFKKVPSNEKNSTEQKNELLDRVRTRSSKKDLPVDSSSTEKQLRDSTVTNESSKNLKARSSTRKTRLRKKSCTSDSQESEQENSLQFRPIKRCNFQELTISKALEEVGITDDKLQYFRSEDNIKVWRCHQSGCNRPFDKLSGLRIHLLSHFGIKPFKCDYDGCTWAFYSNDKLLRHKEFHLNKKEYMCTYPDCRRRFSTLQNRMIHENSHDPPQVVCEVPECSAKFQSKKYLEAHMKTHDEHLFPYLCNNENCGKRFHTMNALMLHKRSHRHSESQLTCTWPNCGKTFKHPCQVKTHMRSHTGHKPYACSFKGCKWAFSTASKLSRHQKNHTNDRKYVCDIGNCGKSYARSDHLRDHKLRHTEARCFQCDYCNASFSLKNALYAHIKKHTNEKFVSKGQYKTKKDKTVKKKNSSKKKLFSVKNLQNAEPNLSIPLMEGKENSDNMYFCPIETCTKWYPTKSSLRMHLWRKHKPPLSEIQNRDVASSNPLPHEASSQNLGKSDSMETEECKLSSNENQGSARTAFTHQDILTLKLNKKVADSNSAPNDVVLDVKNSGGIILLMDDLPSMCCQEDIDVSGYQTLLFDAVPTGNEFD